MPKLEINAEPNEALAEHLKIRRETLDIVREQMQAGFSQLGKELAEIRKTRATEQHGGNDDDNPRITVSRYKSKTDAGETMNTVSVSVKNNSFPPVPVVVESGASVVFNSSITVDLGTHVNMSNHQEEHRKSNTSVAVGDSVMETIGKVIGGLFKL